MLDRHGGSSAGGGQRLAESRRNFLPRTLQGPPPAGAPP
ncbi:hypothetical protein PCLA_08r0175 [Pseudomonas citronellolis]|nr:hypothetical protein PCLA_08r0175 [Pseudomonas citronellolis]